MVLKEINKLKCLREEADNYEMKCKPQAFLELQDVNMLGLP